MELVTDPVELERSRRARAKFDRNIDWLKLHADEIHSKHRGTCVCIAGQELFTGDSPEEAIAKAQAAHPDDDGMFTKYIPRERMVKIYAV